VTAVQITLVVVHVLYALLTDRQVFLAARCQLWFKYV